MAVLSLHTLGRNALGFILSLVLFGLAGCGSGGGGNSNGGPPVAKPADLTTTVNTTITGLLQASDPDGDPLTFSISLNASLGTVNLADASTGEFSYTPISGITGTDSFRFAASDGVNTSAPAIVTIRIVAPAPDAYAVKEDAYTVNEGAALDVAANNGVLANDTHAEAKPLTAFLVTGPSHASNFTLNTDGSFSYLHDGGETITDSFIYRASDGTTASNPVTVSLTITPVNDAPIAVNDSYGVNEGATLNISAASGVLANDTDAEASPLSAILVTGPTRASAFTLNPDGSFSYTHNGSETTTDSFTYQASDGTTASSPVTVSIAITPVNDAPLAVNDSYGGVNEGATLTVNAASGVLANDTDAETSPLTAKLVTNVTHGNLTLNSDGSFSYTHDGSKNFQDSFTYKANDGAKDSIMATVSIAINAAPLANAGPDQDVIENTLVTLAGSGTDSDGSITGYAWSQISGNAVVLSDPSSPAPTFTAPNVSASTTLEFRLTVTDNLGATHSDTVNIHIANTLFSDNFSSGMSAWTPVDDDNNSTKSMSWTVINGELRQQNRVESTNSFDQTYHRGTYAHVPSGSGWTDYRFSVDATYDPDSVTTYADDIGVMFRYKDNDNYYRFSMNSRYGFSRLEKKVGGVFTPLATNARGYQKGQLLGITIDVKGSVLQVFLNGDPLFAVNDSSLASGSIALYTQDKAKFDNVIVRTAGQAPSIMIASPSSYSVTSSNMLNATALAANTVSGDSVEFILDDDILHSIVDTTAPYTAQFTGAFQGDHKLEAILRGSSGEAARDTNIKVGAAGKYYVAVGDSITNGIGDNYAADNASQDGRIIAFQGYEAKLADLLKASTFYPNIIMNEGIGGDESVDTAFTRINSILARHANADRVLLLLGTNDSGVPVPSGQGCSGAACSGTYKGNMQSLINSITATGKEAWVALVPPAFGDTSGNIFANPATATRNTNYIQKYNQVINSSELTNRSIGPDFYYYFLGAGSNRFSLFKDELHPNALGYEVMAHLWHNTLNPFNPVSMPFILDNLTPSTTTPYLKQNLIEPGNKYYVDSTATITGSIPAQLATGRWIMTANAGKSNSSSNYVSFSVDRPVTVYVAYDAAGASTTLPAWMSGYAPTGLTLQTSGDPLTPVLNLYSKSFGAGSIVLGGNLQSPASGADSNYIAVVVE